MLGYPRMRIRDTATNVLVIDNALEEGEQVESDLFR